VQARTHADTASNVAVVMLSNTYTHSHTHAITHTYTHEHTHTHTRTYTHARTHTHTHTHTHRHACTHARTHAHTHLVAVFVDLPGLPGRSACSLVAAAAGAAWRAPLFRLLLDCVLCAVDCCSNTLCCAHCGGA